VDAALRLGLGDGRRADRRLGQCSAPPSSGKGSCSASFTLIHRRAKSGSFLRRDARLYAEAGLAQLDNQEQIPSVAATVFPAQFTVILGEGMGVT